MVICMVNGNGELKLDSRWTGLDWLDYAVSCNITMNCSKKIATSNGIGVGNTYGRD